MHVTTTQNTHEVTFELTGLGKKRADGMPSIIEARKITFLFLVESNIFLF